MTKNKAIEIIRYHKALVNRDKSGLLDKSLEYEAIDMAIKALDKEPCEDAVSRQTVKELFQEACEMEMYDFLGIDDIPSVTHTQKKGKWIVLKDEYGDICEAICSCCEDNGNHKWKYCPNCGAKMDERGREE